MVMPHTTDCGAQKSLAGGGHVWLLPLRQPRLDDEGHMHLSYWSGNEALKGAPLTVPPSLTPPSVAVGVGVGDGVRTAFLPGSEGWDHTVGVVLTGTLHTPNGEGGAVPTIGFALETVAAAPGSSPNAPHDLGPDKGWDRVGNDYDCFGVNASFAVADCAARCESDPKCMAWTTIGVAHELAATDGDRRRLLACNTGHQPLGLHYCTLKAPVPSELVRSPNAATGLPKRSAGAVNGTHRNISTVTSMLMQVKPDTDLTRSTMVYDSVDAWAPLLRDVTGPFECGAGKQTKTCMPATTTGVASGAHDFLLFARHGTAELYVGSPLMLVQTMTYGVYPVSAARLGVAVNGTGGHVEGMRAWAMSL